MSAGTYTADTMEWQEWAVQAGSTAMRVNGSTQSVTDDGTGGNGKWFNSFPGGDTLTYGGFSGGGTYQGYGLGVMGPLAIVGTITAAQRAKLTAYLKQGYSAALS